MIGVGLYVLFIRYRTRYGCVSIIAFDPGYLDVSLSVLLGVTRNCEIALCTLMSEINDDGVVVRRRCVWNTRRSDSTSVVASTLTNRVKRRRPSSTSGRTCQASSSSPNSFYTPGLASSTRSVDVGSLPVCHVT